MKSDSNIIVHRHLVVSLLECVKDILGSGYMADKVVMRALKSHPKWGSRDRKIFSEGVYEMVRWWKYLLYLNGSSEQELLGDAKDTALNDPLQMWHLWATLWLWQKGHPPEIKPNADELKTWQPEKTRKLLTKLSVNQDPETSDDKAHQTSLHQNSKTDLVPRHILLSVPFWLDQWACQELGETLWDKTLNALSKPAPVFIRANTLKTNPKELKEHLALEGFLTEDQPELTELAPHGLRLQNRGQLFKTKSFINGFFEVQDGASQQIAPLLRVQPKMRVVDACAGAGGKTLHIAALMKNQGQIIACDISAKRLEELSRRLRRNGVQCVQTRVIENTKVIKRLEGSADRLLLDVPCSGSGVWRRNPDAKWKIKAENLTQLQKTQEEILQRYHQIVRPGGIMVYATCSIFPSENQNQIQKFLNLHPFWKMEEEHHFLPGQNDFDGFYAAVLKRSDSSDEECKP